MMKISVVCPTYNSQSYLSETLECLSRQTSMPYEVLFIDDGSTDLTLEILKRYQRGSANLFECIIMVQPHRGPGHARNIGIKHARGDWIAFLDSDDIWYPNKLSLVQKEITTNKNVNFIMHNEVKVFHDNDKINLNYYKKYNPNKNLTKQLFLRNIFSTSAITCKREVLMKHNGFSETLMSAQDYDCWIRISSDLNVRFINGVLGEYTVRSKSISSGNFKKRFLNELKIALSHRKLVPSYYLYLRLIRIIGSYILQFIRR